MPSAAVMLNLEVPEVAPPPVVPPIPPPPVPKEKVFPEKVVDWWNSLSTLEKVLVVAGIGSSAIATVSVVKGRKKQG